MCPDYLRCDHTKQLPISQPPTHPDRSAARRKTRWFDAPWINPVHVQTQIHRLDEEDWLGRPLAIAFAGLWCVIVAGPTSALEIGGLPLAVLWLLRFLRFTRARRITWALLSQPMSLVFLLWAGWCALLIVRLPQQHAAWHELAAARWSWCLLALPFVAFARSRWILFVALGFLCVNLGQGVEAIGHRFDIVALQFKHYPDRISAWLDPVSGASSMVGAFGLLLPVAFMGSGRARTLAIAASVVSFCGIIATGSRGAWLAAGMLVMIVALTTMLRAASLPSRRSMFIGLTLVVLVSVPLGVLARGIIQPRIQNAIRDISSVIERGDYSSDTGMRILMAKKAIEFTRANPITGIGPGQFRGAILASDEAKSQSLRDLAPAHAHNTLLHLAATTGLPGVTLWLTMFCLGLRNAWLHANRLGWGTLAAGPFFGLVGLALVSGTDVIQLNQQTCAVLFLLLGLSPSAPFIFPHKADTP